MPPDIDQAPVSGSPVPETTADSPWRLWVLLVWHPELGMAIDPVAVLGVEDGSGLLRRVIRWVPLVYEAADPWRERLGESTTRDEIERWRAQDGTCQMQPVAVPDGATDLPHAADLVLEELLAEVIPALPPRGDA